MNDRLYNLLPVIYRRRDADLGLPLKALMEVLEREFDVIHRDMGTLYDDWFIETCDEWVIPYIGDLLGVEGIRTSVLPSQRALVANTIAYRRRKGTVLAFENVARDATGWPAKATEMFEYISADQHLRFVRPGAGSTVDLRDQNALAWIGTPFDALAHSIDVTTAAMPGVNGGFTRADYNLGTVDLALWRLRSYPVIAGDAAVIADGCATFDPLGRSLPLFAVPCAGSGDLKRTDARSVPDRARRAPLDEELESLRQAKADDRVASAAFFDGDAPIFALYLDGSTTAVPPEEIVIADLGDLPEGGWSRPAAQREYQPQRSDLAPVLLPITAAVDPVRGRIALAEGVSAESIRVSYAYGFSAAFGGGPYERRATIAAPAHGTWHCLVAAALSGGFLASLQSPANSIAVYPTLEAAVAAWSASGKNGTIFIDDSATYELKETLVVDLGSAISPEGTAVPARTLTIVAANRARPVIVGSIAVHGNASECRLELNGLWIAGSVQVGCYVDLGLVNCTVRADGDEPAISATEDDHVALRISASHSLLGPLALPSSTAHIRLQDCIVGGTVRAHGVMHLGSVDLAEPVWLIGPDRFSRTSVGVTERPGPRTVLERTTVLGNVRVLGLAASNSIFEGIVDVRDVQDGDVRYCSLPPGARTSRRFRCQPDLALAARAAELGLASPDELPPEESTAVAARVRPRFTSTEPGDPGFGQLDSGCAVEVITGAENGYEFGAFNELRLPYRLANLSAVIEEYLPFGMTAGISFVT